MRKCTKVKNPCKICLQSVTHKNGVQCKGACKKWAHYTCLNYTPGKIQDIKAGIITVTCPCPNCNVAPENKEILTPIYHPKCPGNGKCGTYECPNNRKASPIPLVSVGISPHSLSPCKQPKCAASKTVPFPQKCCHDPCCPEPCCPPPRRVDTCLPEPGRPEPCFPEPGRPKPRCLEPRQPEFSYPEPRYPDPSLPRQSELDYPEQRHPELGYHEPRRPEPSFSESRHPEPRYPEPRRTEPSFNEPRRLESSVPEARFSESHPLLKVVSATAPTNEEPKMFNVRTVSRAEANHQQSPENAATPPPLTINAECLPNGGVSVTIIPANPSQHRASRIKSMMKTDGNSPKSLSCSCLCCGEMGGNKEYDENYDKFESTSVKTKNGDFKLSSSDSRLFTPSVKNEKALITTIHELCNTVGHLSNHIKSLMGKMAKNETFREPEECENGCRN